jgi:IMP cyclohydrolase
MILHGEMSVAFGVLDVSTSKVQNNPYVTYVCLHNFSVVVTYFNY